MEENLEVFSDVSLTIYEKDRLAIMGASGVGKSTLLHVLGLLDNPRAGDLLFFAHNHEKEMTIVYPNLMSDNQRTDFRGRFIGFVYQSHHLLPDFNALENVMMPGQLMEKSSTQMKKRAKVLLEKVGLKDRLHHLPKELSGGQQQRVAIARALILKPTFIFADEPTGNLDEENSKNIMELLLDLHREENFAFVMATHNSNLLAYMNRLMIMEKGTLKEHAL